MQSNWQMLVLLDLQHQLQDSRSKDEKISNKAILGGEKQKQLLVQ